MMTMQDIEQLYIRSFDEVLNAKEEEMISNAFKSDPGLAAGLGQYGVIRTVVLRKTPATFGPYFARKVVARIQNVGIQIDRQIFAYFKKYQLVALGIVMALLALNAVVADQLNLQSIFGLEDTTQETEEIVSFDFNELINK
jgi:hypothetical protein